MSNNKKVVISSKLFSSLSPMFYLCRAFGLLPLCFRKTANENIELKWSWKLSLYGYGLFILFVILTFLGLSREFQIDVVYKTKMANVSKYITFTEFLMIISIGALGVTLPTKHIKIMCKYLQYLNQIDTTLPEDKNTISFSSNFKATIFPTLLHWTIMALDLYFWYKVTMNSQNFSTLFVNQFPSYFLYYYVTLLQTMFFYLVSTLRKRMDKFVSYIECLSSSYEKIDVAEKQNILHISDSYLGEYVKSKNILTREVLLKNNKILYCISPSTLDVLTRTYELLYCAAQCINKFFGAIMLIILLSCLMHLVITPYCLSAMLDNTRSNMFLISQTSWMIAHIVRLAGIVEPCHACLSEVSKMRFLLCKHLSSDLDEPVKKKIERLCSQLSLCPIEFSASDMVDISRRLYTSISGIVMTYLVILFQFRQK